MSVLNKFIKKCVKKSIKKTVEETLKVMLKDIIHPVWLNVEDEGTKSANLYYLPEKGDIFCIEFNEEDRRYIVDEVHTVCGEFYTKERLTPMEYIVYLKRLYESI